VPVDDDFEWIHGNGIDVSELVKLTHQQIQTGGYNNEAMMNDDEANDAENDVNDCWSDCDDYGPSSVMMMLSNLNCYWPTLLLRVEVED